MEFINSEFDKVSCIVLSEESGQRFRNAKNNFNFFNIKVDYHKAVKHGNSNVIASLLTNNNKGRFNYSIQPNEFACAWEHYSVIKEAYIEGVIEYENLLNEYYIKEQEVNMSLYSELEHIYKTCVPVKTMDLADIYFCSTKQ